MQTLKNKLSVYENRALNSIMSPENQHVPDTNKKQWQLFNILLWETAGTLNLCLQELYYCLVSLSPYKPNCYTV